MPRSDAGAGSADIVRKASAHPDTHGPEYVMSDGTVDRIGDVIEPSGWDLRNFSPGRNPIALFNHISNLPIGRWENVRVERGQLRGHLKLAKRGTSERIDEIISLQEQGILRATSVGFRPLERELMHDEKGGATGYRFTKHELIECSLVSVPANANALQIAKDLRISADVQRCVFGEPADATRARYVRGWTGELAANLSSRKSQPMELLASKIEAAQRKLDDLTEQQTAHLDQIGDDPDEASQLVTEELNGKLALAKRSLDNLIEAEAQMGSRAVQVTHERKAINGEVLPPMRRPFAAPAEKEPSPSDRVLRVLVGHLLAGARRRWDPTATPLSCIAERYGSDGKIDDKTKGLSEILARGEGYHAHPDLVLRAATAPATTFTSGWASQLAAISVQGFLDLLLPASVFPGVAARAYRASFGRAGVISIPRRVATPTIAGAFVLEGNAIPVKQGAITAITFGPKKMGVISTITREISEHSTPDIEQIIRNAMQEDTAVVLDNTLLDAVAATTTRPGGIRAGVSVTTATAGGGFAALVGDIKALLGAVNTIVSGNLRRPIWLMNPAQAIAISMTQNAGGDFPFKQEINNNTLSGYPVIVSGNVPAGMVIFMDAADFAIIEGNAPRFDVSDQATLHMEDTAPTDISSGAGPTPAALTNIAAPVKSMFQTDSLALRMIFDVNWGHLRATPSLAWTQAVTW